MDPRIQAILDLLSKIHGSSSISSVNEKLNSQFDRAHKNVEKINEALVGHK